MHPRRFVLFWLALAMLLTALMALAMFGSTAAAQSGEPPSAATSESPRDSMPDTAAIETLVAAMQDAVRAQDRDAYLITVDLSDPVFRSEHTYWINDWMTTPPDRFSLAINAISVNDASATGMLTVTWALQPDVSIRRATFPARFVQTDSGAWQFAGGAWETLETEHFLVHYGPGMQSIAQDVVAMLPEIYDHATGSLDFMPETLMHIKLYDQADAIGALTALSLPPIGGWNEPGESLKMLVPSGSAPSAAVLAHELTHFLAFEMAGSTRGAYPWWLMEGVAEYVASEYWDDSARAARLDAVREWAAAGKLAPWDEISTFEDTPVELWRYVYPQGYAFARFVSEEYGSTTRNDWISAMAGDMDLAAATGATFDTSFEALSADFDAWLTAPAD